MFRAGVRAGSGSGSGSVFGQGQVWAKPQPGGAEAALVINHGGEPLQYSITLDKLNLTAASYSARDIWARANIPGAVTAAHGLHLTVAPYDSAFVLLTPSS